MKMIKWMAVSTLMVFGFLLNAQAAYLLGMDEASQKFTLTVFDTSSGSVVQSYSTRLPSEVENVVYTDSNLAYGFGPSSRGRSTLYKFILSDDGTVNYDQSWDYKNIKDVDSIALAGDSLYAVNHNNGKLYSIDLEDKSSKEIKLKTKASNVQALSYNSQDGLLYGIDADGGDDELFSIDLSASKPTVTTIGSTGVNGIEALSFGDDGSLFAVADETLHMINLGTGSAFTSIDLGGWADDIEGLSYFSSGSAAVPEPGSALAWLLIVGGAVYMVRRKRADKVGALAGQTMNAVSG